jgi:chromate transport protein ChrA
VVRTLGYLLAGVALVLAGAIVAWLFVAAATNYGGECSDGERQAFQLAFSGVALAAALSAGAGLYRRWRRVGPSRLLSRSVLALVLAGGFSVLMVGCGG